MRKPFFIILILCTAACGTSRSSGPLQSRINDTYLAPVPVEKLEALADANRAAFLAQWQVLYTKTLVQDARRQVQIAGIDKKKAKLTLQAAGIKDKRSADAIAPNKHQRLAKLELSAAGMTLTKSKQELRYLEALLKADQLAYRQAQAHIELTKAKGLTAAGIRPPGFQLNRYQAQYQQSSQTATVARNQAEIEKRKLDPITARWNQAVKQVDTAQQPSPPTEPTEETVETKTLTNIDTQPPTSSLPSNPDDIDGNNTLKDTQP